MPGVEDWDSPTPVVPRITPRVYKFRIRMKSVRYDNLTACKMRPYRVKTADLEVVLVDRRLEFRRFPFPGFYDSRIRVARWHFKYPFCLGRESADVNIITITVVRFSYCNIILLYATSKYIVCEKRTESRYLFSITRPREFPILWCEITSVATLPEFRQAVIPSLKLPVTRSQTSALNSPIARRVFFFPVIYRFQFTD